METNLELEGTRLLEETQSSIDQGFKIILHEGGSRSSKTWSVLQFFILRALAGHEEVITIAREKMTWLKATILKDFFELVELYGLDVYPDLNDRRPEQTYYINGTEFSFFGADDSKKLHGRKQDWFWLNEAMEMIQKTFDQLEMRTKKGAILDYNPYDDLHWVFNLQKRPDVYTINSTMLDNPFLPDTIINKILGYEPTQENMEQGTADDYMWQVYGLGKKARLKGVIFEDWEAVDEIPEDAEDLGLGLDFGYSNDPAALVEIYKHNKTIYLNELLYEPELTNISIKEGQDSLDKRFKELNIGNRPITADSSEPKSIDELSYAGWNIEGAEKGPDSVKYGIDLMKGFKICYTRSSPNIDRESRRYKWAENRNGEPIRPPRPIDDFNHLIDAARYRIMRVLGRKTEIKIFSGDIFA